MIAPIAVLPAILPTTAPTAPPPAAPITAPFCERVAVLHPAVSIIQKATSKVTGRGALVKNVFFSILTAQLLFFMI
jgi:hypothetical protein